MYAIDWEATIFWTAVPLLFVGVYLFGKYVLPRLNKARKIEDKQS